MSQPRTSDASLDAALRRLDAGPVAPLDEVARVRAAAVLERTLVVGRFPDERASSRRDSLLPRPRRTGARLAVLGAAAAAVAVGIGATQVLGGGTTAYADSWEPVPVPATSADVAAAREACADSETSMAEDGGAPLEVQLAERRGDLVLLAMDDGTAQPQTLTCLAAVVPGKGARMVAAGGGGGLAAAPGTVSDPGIFMRSTPGDELSAVDGVVGDGVRDVSVITDDGRTVRATVQNGHYAAWWPGLAMRSTSEPYPSGQSGGCAGDCDGTRLVETFTLEVTLDDGTVVQHVVPTPG